MAPEMDVVGSEPQRQGCSEEDGSHPCRRCIVIGSSRWNSMGMLSSSSEPGGDCAGLQVTFLLNWACSW